MAPGNDMSDGTARGPVGPSAADRDEFIAAFARLPVLAVSAIFWALLAVALLSNFWGASQIRIATPDDAMRLVEVRAFLDGAAWFNPVEPRIGLDGTYLTHWSRLIDAPIALMMRVFGETFALAAWPLLLLLVTIMSMAAMAERVAGRQAGLIAALFGALCLAGFSQFRPGIIHHHNAQLAASAAFVALLLAAPASRFAAVGAGFAGALALAFGLESVPVLAVAIAFYVLRFVWSPQDSRNPGLFGLSFAAFTGLLFVVTIPPSRWSVTECDALALNTLLLATIGGIGLFLVEQTTSLRSLGLRLAGMIAVAVVAVGAFVASDRSCLAGPYGHFDPALWPVWLDYVAEMLSAKKLAAVEPIGAALYFSFPALALAGAAYILWRDRNWNSVMLAVNFLALFAIAVMHVRGVLYASFYAVPVMAIAIAKLRDAGSFQSVRAIAIALAIANPAFVAVAAVAIVPENEDSAPPSAKGAACFDTAAYKTLAQLPPGLVLAQLDLATYVLAHTPHRVVMGPYHRLDRDLVFARKLIAGPPADAEAPLRKSGVTYVVDCAGLLDRFADRKEPMSFRTALTGGYAPAFLTPVPMGGSPLLVWRMEP